MPKNERSKLIGELVMAHGDNERLRERIAIKDAAIKRLRCKTCSGTGKEFNELIGEYIVGSKCPDCNK